MQPLNLAQPAAILRLCVRDQNYNHILFRIRGNNSAASFRLRLTDSAGRTAEYGVQGDNQDFVCTDIRTRRIVVDLEGDRPARDGGCDVRDIAQACLELDGDPGGTVWADGAELFYRPSLSAAWETRKQQLAAQHSRLLTQNEPAPGIRMVDDIAELKEILARLKAEKGPYDGDFIRAEGTRFVHSATGETFTPIGTNYLGMNFWEPQIFKFFAPDEIDEDFAIMHTLGYNTLRLAFTSYIHYAPDDEEQVEEGCLLKLGIILELARKHGLRVMLVGLDGEPPARFKDTDILSDGAYVTMLANRFENTARLFADHPAIFAWNIFNELTVPWTSPFMEHTWRAWQEARGVRELLPTPPDEYGAPGLQKYQQFREDVAREYIKTITEAVRRGTPNHMVTCGTLQWSFPLMRPGDAPSSYAAANPRRFAEFVDFVCPHYYPLYSENLLYPPEHFHINLQGLRGWIRFNKLGKPILLEEFGSPGGGDFWGRHYTQNQQAQFGRAIVDTTAADVAGYINWPFQDTPSSTDISTWTGLIDVEKRPKQWGAELAELVRTADRTPGRPAQYAIDKQRCTTEQGSGGFANYIRRGLNEYLAYIHNNDADITITEGDSLQ